MYGPQNWPVLYAACSDTSAIDSLGEPERSAAERAAIEFLWNWTGRVFGQVPVTLRPCRTDCGRRRYGTAMNLLPSSTPWEPALIAGRWYNIGCGVCGDSCSCSGLVSSIRLPGPVYEVEWVIVDGVMLDPLADYRLDNHALLVRTDGGIWPPCQNLSLPSGSAGTWEVSYQYGVEVPHGGQIAAGVLASEIAKSICDDDGCQLPQRVQTVTRQGVTMALLDGMEGLSEGKTGIWLVDSWITSIIKPPRGGRVRSPDIGRHRFQ